MTGVITGSSFVPFAFLFEPCALLCPFLLLPLLFIPPLHLYLLYSTVFGLHSWFHAFSLWSSKISSLSIVLFCLLFVDLLSLNQLDHYITIVHAIPFFFFYVSYSSWFLFLFSIPMIPFLLLPIFYFLLVNVFVFFLIFFSSCSSSLSSFNVFCALSYWFSFLEHCSSS